MSGYRIVEQLLSWAGPGCNADVCVTFAPDALELRVGVAAMVPEPGEASAPDALAAPVAAQRAALHGGSLNVIRLADRLQWVARLPVTAGRVWA